MPGTKSGRGTLWPDCSKRYMTCFSHTLRFNSQRRNSKEAAVELTYVVPFLLEDELITKGAKYQKV